MGEIFLERNSINLHSEVLDTPEFFWNYPELEPFYRRTAHYLDVVKRVEALNKRLNVVYELFGILSTEVNHRHTVRLEFIIVLLILIEVLLATLRDVFHIFLRTYLKPGQIPSLRPTVVYKSYEKFHRDRFKCYAFSSASTN